MLNLLKPIVTVLLLAESGHSASGVLERQSLARAGQFPYVAALIRASNNKLFCTGNIITSQWVLTSSRCLLNKKPGDIRVAVGVVDDRRNHQPMNGVKEIVRHDNSSRNHGGVALIQVVRPFVFSRYVAPIKIGTVSTNGTQVSVSYARPGRKSRTSLLKFVQIKVTDMPLCKNSEYFICAKNVRGPGTAGRCSTDSGRPLVDYSTGKLVGVDLTSEGACKPAFVPTGYARIDAYADWIKKIVGSLE